MTELEKEIYNQATNPSFIVDTAIEELEPKVAPDDGGIISSDDWNPPR